MIQLTLTLKTTTAQDFEKSVTFNNNGPIQDYIHRDDHTQPTYEMTIGFKAFTVFILCCSNSSHASPIKDNTRSIIVLIKKINWRDATHFDSEDNYRTGFRNVSHFQLQQSYWGLCSPRWSFSTYLRNDSWVQTFHSIHFMSLKLFSCITIKGNTMSRIVLIKKSKHHFP